MNRIKLYLTVAKGDENVQANRRVFTRYVPWVEIPSVGQIIVVIGDGWRSGLGAVVTRHGFGMSGISVEAVIKTGCNNYESMCQSVIEDGFQPCLEPCDK